jgi:hypothetical protein
MRAELPSRPARRGHPILLTRRMVMAGLAFGSVLRRASAAEGDAAPLRMVVFGDSQAEGVAAALHRLFHHQPGYVLQNRTKPGTAIGQTATYDWPAAIQGFAASDPAPIVVMMFGGNDRLPIKTASGTMLPFQSDAWRAIYMERLANMLDPLAKAGTHVLWLGQPVTRDAGYCRDMAFLNTLYRAALAEHGGSFIDLWSVVADPAGGYLAYGKSLAGVTERLRLDDGIHFTPAGYDLVAARVGVEIDTLARSLRAAG